MNGDKTQSVHVQIPASEAVQAKKQLLEVQLQMLNSLERAINIRELREIQYKIKNQMREVIKHLSHDTRLVSEILPGIEQLPEEKKVMEKSKKSVKVPKQKKEGISKRMRLETELMGIRQKLERLSR